MKKRLISYFLIIVMLCCLVNSATPQTVSADPGAFAQMRARWKEVLTGGDHDITDPQISQKITSIVNSANSAYNSMVKNPTAYLWSDLQSTSDSGQLGTAYQRLYNMALAYSTKGTGADWYGNQTKLNDMLKGFDWMYTNRYNENITQYGTAWDWWCGAGRAICDFVLLLSDRPEMTQTRKDNFDRAVKKRLWRVGVASGQNLLWNIRVIAVRSIIMENTSADSGILNARTAFNDVMLKYTPFENRALGKEEADGFYTDGTFIQHFWHPYTAGYGSELLKDISPLMYMFADTPWDLETAQKELIFNWVYDSFEPIIWKGAAMDMFSGRYQSRNSSPDHYLGSRIIDGLVALVPFAESEDAARLKSMIKYFIQSDTTYYSESSPYFISKAKEIINDSAVVPRANLNKTYQMHVGARTVHHSNGFAFGIAMTNETLRRYENIGGSGAEENKRGWYTAAGATYLYNDDIRQFANNYWATVNNYRIPGTTVDTISRGDGSGSSSKGNQLTGGASNGKYGVSATYLTCSNSSLNAKKSWFMFDDEIVSLGSNINNSGQTGNGWDGQTRRTETIVENRKLDGSYAHAFTVNGTAQSTEVPSNYDISNVTHAHLQGKDNNTNESIGYYFPTPVNLKGRRVSTTGKWGTINTSIKPSGDPNYTNRFLEMWLEHGTDSTNGSYAYVTLPNRTSAQTESYKQSPDIRILEQNDTVHAVRHVAKGDVPDTLGAFFWKDSVTPQWLKDGSNYVMASNKPSAVLLTETANELEVVVSDPTRANNGKIIIELHKNASQALSLPAEVTIHSLAPIRFSVDVNGSEGKEIRVRFDLTGTEHLDPPAEPAVPQESILEISEGTWVSNLAEDSPRSSTELTTGQSRAAKYSAMPDGIGKRSIVMKFDLSEITDPIISAELYGTIKNSMTGMGTIYALEDNWTESATVYDDVPPHDPLRPLSSISWPTRSAYTTQPQPVKLGDLAHYLDRERTGDGVASIMLHLPVYKGTDDNADVLSISMENNEAPYLKLITFEGGEGLVPDMPDPIEPEPVIPDQFKETFDGAKGGANGEEVSGYIPPGWTTSANMVVYAEAAPYFRNKNWSSMTEQAIYDQIIWKGRYVYTVDVRNEASNNNNKVRIIFNYTDNNNYYYLQLGGSTTNTVQLCKRAGSTTEQVISEYSGSYEAYQSWRTMEISYLDGYISVKAKNGTAETALFEMIPDSTHKQGKIGVSTNNSVGYFRNISVRVLGEGEGPNAPEVIRIYPIGNTWVTNETGSPTRDANELRTGESSNAELYAGLVAPSGTGNLASRSILLRFDLSEIADRNILSATLNGYIRNWTGGTGRIYPLDDTWEMTATKYADVPNFFTDSPITTANWPYVGNSDYAAPFFLGSITNYIKSEYAGDGVASMALHLPVKKSNDTNVDLLTLRSMNDAAKKPYIELVLYEPLPEQLIISDPELTIGQENITSTGIKPGLVTASLRITNGTTTDATAVIILALYNGDKLEQVSFSDSYVLKALTRDKILTEEISIGTVTNNHTLKIFLWDECDTLNPITDNPAFVFDNQGRVE